MVNSCLMNFFCHGSNRNGWPYHSPLVKRQFASSHRMTSPPRVRVLGGIFVLVIVVLVVVMRAIARQLVELGRSEAGGTHRDAESGPSQWARSELGLEGVDGALELEDQVVDRVQARLVAAAAHRA